MGLRKFKESYDFRNDPLKGVLPQRFVQVGAGSTCDRRGMFNGVVGSD
jgi:hypothetical protein